MTINPTSTPCVYLGCKEPAVAYSSACAKHDAPALAAPQLPTQTRLTTDEAENGALWGFARSYESEVRVAPNGLVFFSARGDERQAYDVVVDGVVHPIVRERVLDNFYPAAPVTAPVVPTAPLCNVFDCLQFARPDDLCCTGHATHHSKLSKPAPTPHAPAWDYQPAHPGLNEGGLEPAEPADDEEDEAHGWADELEAAKERARYLLTQWNGGSKQLTEVQYIAIFGELPQ